MNVLALMTRRDVPRRRASGALGRARSLLVACARIAPAARPSWDRARVGIRDRDATPARKKSVRRENETPHTDREPSRARGRAIALGAVSFVDARAPTC